MSTGSYLNFNISFERNRIFSSTVSTKPLGDVFLMRKSKVFPFFVMSSHAEDTLVPIRLLKKCYKVGSIDILFSKIPLNSARCAEHVKW